MNVRTADVMAEPSPRWTRLVVVGVALVIAALGWITWQALRLEERERVARREAAFSESLRLALWRMDSALTPIIAREAARPYFEYQSFYPADRAMRSLEEPATPDDVLVPSPLLTTTDPLIRAYFQRSSGGEVTSPQTPEAWMKQVATGVYVTAYDTQAAHGAVEQLREMFASASKQAQKQEDALKPRSRIAGGASEQPARAMERAEAKLDDKFADYQQRRSVASQAANVVTPPAAAPGAATEEAAKRGDVMLFSAGKSQDSVIAEQDAAGEAMFGANPVVQSAPAVRLGEFVARWLPGPREEPELVFVREVAVGSLRVEQGFWVNWPVLREQVMGSARELLPQATLEPVLEPVDVLPVETVGRMLANVPAELVVQRVDGTRVPLWSPLRSALLATWLVVLAAVVGLVFVARGATQLAERRGRFVSAVTHELRTPLTTFRMYSQMLADGMVSSQEAQREYARTLYDESGRLARIVESVLDYARLGRGTSQPQLDESTVGEMLDGLLSGLVSHAAASGMSLELQGLDNVVRQRRLRTDVNRVQRVLLNLVENACKYAKDASDKRVVCVVEVEHRDLRIRVRDFGPGVPVKERAAIFKAFTRGAAHAHGSVPGLGLGLALCRALAEQLGGSLALTGHTGGAEFTLTLPLTT
ncbi:MAG: sensor histidine kinase [Phycisphaerae bacterium]